MITLDQFLSGDDIVWSDQNDARKLVCRTITFSYFKDNNEHALNIENAIEAHITYMDGKGIDIEYTMFGRIVKNTIKFKDCQMIDLFDE